MCIVANCSWSCVYCVIVLCVLLLHHVYCVYCCTVYCSAGLLARSQYSEGPATGHLGTGFPWFPSVCLKANAEMVPKTPSCYCMLLMQPSRLKFLSSLFHIYVHE